MRAAEPLQECHFYDEDEVSTQLSADHGCSNHDYDEDEGSVQLPTDRDRDNHETPCIIYYIHGDTKPRSHTAIANSDRSFFEVICAQEAYPHEVYLYRLVRTKQQYPHGVVVCSREAHSFRIARTQKCYSHVVVVVCSQEAYSYAGTVIQDASVGEVILIHRYHGGATHELHSDHDYQSKDSSWISSEYDDGAHFFGDE